MLLLFVKAATGSAVLAPADLLPVVPPPPVLLRPRVLRYWSTWMRAER